MTTAEIESSTLEEALQEYPVTILASRLARLVEEEFFYPRDRLLQSMDFMLAMRRQKLAFDRKEAAFERCIQANGAAKAFEAYEKAMLEYVLATEAVDSVHGTREG
jgi:hypothetical protein